METPVIGWPCPPVSRRLDRRMKKRTIAVSLLLIGAAYAAISRVERRIDDRFGETGFPRTDDLDCSGEPRGFEEADGEDSVGRGDGARIDSDGDIARNGVVTHTAPDFDPAYWTDERVANALPAKMPPTPPRKMPSGD